MRNVIGLFEIGLAFKRQHLKGVGNPILIVHFFQSGLHLFFGKILFVPDRDESRQDRTKVKEREREKEKLGRKRERKEKPALKMTLSPKWNWVESKRVPSFFLYTLAFLSLFFVIVLNKLIYNL